MPLALLVLENAAGEDARILGIGLLPLHISIDGGGFWKETQHILPLLSPSGAHALVGLDLCRAFGYLRGSC